MRVPKRKGEEDQRKLKQDEPLYLTAKGVENLKRKLERIKEEIPSVREELITAREMGDLSENAAYSIAKANLRRLQNQELRITEDLKNVIIIEEGESEEIRLGSNIQVLFNGREFNYQIVGEREADPMKGRISYKSPIGNAILGMKKGDKAEVELPAGIKKIEIININ